MRGKTCQLNNEEEETSQIWKKRVVFGIIAMIAPRRECIEYYYASGIGKGWCKGGNDDMFALTGAGRSFVARADIGEMSQYSAVEGKRFADYGNGVFLKIENMTKPVSPAMRWLCIGWRLRALHVLRYCIGK